MWPFWQLGFCVTLWRVTGAENSFIMSLISPGIFLEDFGLEPKIGLSLREEFAFSGFRVSMRSYSYHFLSTCVRSC